MNRKIDIEKLLRWTVRDELQKRLRRHLAAWDAIADMTRSARVVCSKGLRDGFFFRRDRARTRSSGAQADWRRACICSRTRGPLLRGEALVGARGFRPPQYLVIARKVRDPTRFEQRVPTNARAER
ncbi:hypothetical protein BRAS3843_2000003 [Bradyrhizobium sp. STM 3843]|nr:hypothetical protein BRAS3843_2000003 [Bradyrhizobium sp. STM 3843]